MKLTDCFDYLIVVQVVFAHSLRGLDAAALLGVVLVFLVVRLIAIVLLDALAGIVGHFIAILARSLLFIIVIVGVVIVMDSSGGACGGGGATAPAVGHRLVVLLRLLLAVVGF